MEKTKKSQKNSKNANPFSDLHPLLIDALSKVNITSLTPLQLKTLSTSFKEKNLISSSYIHSGKSLSVLISYINRSLYLDDTTKTSFIIVSPSREAASSLAEKAKEIVSSITEKKVGVVFVTDGANRKQERLKITTGQATIVIGTPQRIIEYLNDKNILKFFDALQGIAIDDVDTMLKVGYGKEVKELVKICIDTEVRFEIYGNDLDFKIFDDIDSGIKYEKIIVDSKNDTTKKEKVTIKEIDSKIKQGFIVIPQEKKTQFLITFLKKYLNSKIVVSFETNKQVEFFANLLTFFHIPTIAIIKEIDSKKQFDSFVSSSKGILLCTNNITKMKLHVPQCDWVILFDAPNDNDSYVNRFVFDKKTNYTNMKIIVLVLDHEKPITKEISNLTEFEFNVKKMPNEESKIIKLVNKKDHYLYVCAFEAYKSFLFNYALRANKEIFNIDLIDETKMCKNYGFENPPYVNLTSVLSLEEKMEMAESKKGLKRFHLLNN